MLNLVRDVLDVDTAFLCGGNIRGDKDYGDTRLFTFSHLKAELPFDTRISVCQLPGWLICEMISYCRQFALQSPPIVKGCYMQTDDGVSWDEETNTVSKIGFREIADPNKLYRCAINSQILEGVDSIVPLMDYLRDRPDNHAGTLNAADLRRASMELRNIIVGFCTKQTIANLLTAHPFISLDSDQDGCLCDAELIAGLDKIGLHKSMTVLMLHNTVHMADHTHTHHLSQEELVKFAVSVASVEGRKARLEDGMDDQLMSFDEFHEHVTRYLVGTDGHQAAIEIIAPSSESNNSQSNGQTNGHSHHHGHHHHNHYKPEHVCRVAKRLFDLFDVNKTGMVSLKHMGSQILSDSEIDAVVT
jgi:hypothetical protein